MIPDSDSNNPGRSINAGEDSSTKNISHRTLARTVAFQTLYQDDLNPGSRDRFGESFLRQEIPDHEPSQRFARGLVAGVAREIESIDAELSAVVKHWSLDRLNATDRGILRLATYEILFTETPKPIVINEAVELAKKFGTNDSAAFVNGVLDKIGRQ